MSLRRAAAIVFLFALPFVYFVLFAQDPLPARSGLVIDWDRVRALAGPAETGPRAIRSEVVARGRFFGWMICAGCGWGEVPMEFRTYQLEYADGRSVVIDAVHDAERHAAMPMMADYDASAFERQTAALRRAERILLTHEHWDHANGLRAVIDEEAVRPHLVIPEAQRHSAAMREAGLEEDELQGLPAAPDVDLRPVAPGVVAIAMPGHTPGSQVVYVRRADGAELLFLGDIVWNARNLRERRGKSRLISLVAGEDRGAIGEQIAYFAELAAEGSTPGSGWHFVVAHDPEQNAALIEGGLIEPGLASGSVLRSAAPEDAARDDHAEAEDERSARLGNGGRGLRDDPAAQLVRRGVARADVPLGGGEERGRPELDLPGVDAADRELRREIDTEKVAVVSTAAGAGQRTRAQESAGTGDDRRVQVVGRELQVDVDEGRRADGERYARVDRVGREVEVGGGLGDVERIDAADAGAADRRTVDREGARGARETQGGDERSQREQRRSNAIAKGHGRRGPRMAFPGIGCRVRMCTRSLRTGARIDRALLANCACST
ncbi:MBL fold metallo-hydrolase [Myxococcota bacterium]|nr:MBL fold metallo-hydrolase [Myxococcota bacterium]